ncbi:hypothetical protein M758_2G236200 [Ceratodon purpureus]|nr:hypothetical protein M758_2G236200 [Ceratodon purpureus]KAG0627895.1 hypothetical protein M758_2G236200 [Ceratodon purpureus]
MVMGGKHALARKPRVLEIMCIFLGLFIISSLLLTSVSRRHHSARLVYPSNFAPEAKTLKAGDWALGDRTLDGLLLPPKAYEPGQCIARSEESLIRKPSAYRPSSHLIAKLRDYEVRHKRCAPKAVHFSQNGTNSMEDLGDCQFVVWIANSGLGNRMITIASAFVYALLTDRVLLLDHNGTDIGGLYCEPFPGTSWLLPENYDYRWMDKVVWENDHRLGRLLQSSGYANVTLPAPVPNNYVFANLMHNNDEHDKRFFCGKVQRQLKRVPLLYWRSNVYVVPGLHFVYPFHRELDLMFPERDTVFHHMSRYLFRPSNLVWGTILRFRQPHLAAAHRQVGLQLRILESNITAPAVADQLLACVLEKKILPQQSPNTEDKLLSSKTGSTAVLVTSLDEVYYQKLQNYYLDLPAEGPDYIGVHTPSKEETQQFGFDHDKKAWVDMYLLSLSDTLVTSPQSTFGYVGQALAGATPWILTKTKSAETAEETFQEHGYCNRGISLEPCFHAPPLLDCKGRGPGHALDPSSILHFIKPCEDVLGGVKIMPSTAGDRTDERLHQPLSPGIKI